MFDERCSPPPPSMLAGTNVALTRMSPPTSAPCESLIQASHPTYIVTGFLYNICILLLYYFIILYSISVLMCTARTTTSMSMSCHILC